MNTSVVRLFGVCSRSSGFALLICCLASLFSSIVNAAPSIEGVYQAISDSKVLVGGLRNSGSPEEVKVENSPAVNELTDPYDLCQPIGPFRMMAQDRVKVEIISLEDRILLLFEDVPHGNLRNLYFNSRLSADLIPGWAWQGQSIAHWDGDTLQVETNGFNDRTWLNSSTLANQTLTLTETIRPLQGGELLEYRMTAYEKDLFKKPYTYIRYLEKVDQPIKEHLCEINSNWSL